MTWDEYDGGNDGTFDGTEPIPPCFLHIKRGDKYIHIDLNGRLLVKGFKLDERSQEFYETVARYVKEKGQGLIINGSEKEETKPSS